MAARKPKVRKETANSLTKHYFSVIQLQVEHALAEINEATGRVQSAMRDLDELKRKLLTNQRKR